jgi:hypothetical protein
LIDSDGSAALLTANRFAASNRSAPRRVVLIGASNLTRGIDVVLEAARHAWGGPLEAVAALGRGRSFGRASSLLGRQLPGILDCGLWQVINRWPTGGTAALVTDIGNDLLYEEPVEQIGGWVEACLDRLAAVEARTVVTLLPIDNLRTLSPARYTLLRAVFFPHSRIRLETVSERARVLNEHVRRLAAERNFGVVAPRIDWYGFDPIHIRLRHLSRAWREIFSGWHDEVERPLARGNLARSLYVQTRVPEWRRVLGFEQRRAQPAARLRDGSTVALY